MSSSLEEVATAFTVWRAGRSRCGRVPADLSAQAVTLSERYSKAEIIRSLGISRITLDKWIAKSRPQPDFVTLPAPEPAPPESGITVRLQGGGQIAVTGSPCFAAGVISELHQRGLL